MCAAIGPVVLSVAALAVLAIVWTRVFPRPPAFPRASLASERRDGRKIPFNVEVATSPEQQEYGLMYRRALPRDAGMLFLFTRDRPVGMWMKDTYIPLDMLFVRKDGSIANIVAHAEPLSRATNSGTEPVRAVIEINADEAARDGIRAGDKVLYPAFGSMEVSRP